MYSVRGRTAATAATLDHAIATLWNPHTTQAIKVVSFSLAKQGGAGAAGDSVRLKRATARGTPGSTVTPDIDNHHLRGVAPPSGALLDLAAYTVQPTLDPSDLPIGWTAPNVQGAFVVYPIPGGVVVPAGQGLTIAQTQATAWPASEAGFTWAEDW